MGVHFRGNECRRPEEGRRPEGHHHHHHKSENKMFAGNQFPPPPPCGQNQPMFQNQQMYNNPSFASAPPSCDNTMNTIGSVVKDVGTVASLISDFC